jgi:hypothetical protein
MALEDIIRDRGNTGALSGVYEGQKFASDQASSLADTAQKQANLSRYNQETPSAVQQSQNLAEKGRIDNLQGQADAQQGLQNLNAQQRAMVTKQAIDRIPKDVLEKAHADTQKTSVENLGIITDVLQSGGDMKTAFDRARSHLADATSNLPPDEAKQEMAKYDTATQQALAKYDVSPELRQQFLDEVKNHRYSLASTASLADPATQTKKGEIDQQQTAETQRSAANNATQLQVAGMQGAAKEAAAANGKQSAAQIKEKWVKLAEDPNTSPSDRKMAIAMVKDLGAMEISHTGGLVPEANVKDSRTPVLEAEHTYPASGAAAPAVKPQMAAATSYLKAAKTQDELTSRMAQLRKSGWTEAQIGALK